MKTNRIEKEALVANTITFTQSDGAVDTPNPTLQNVTVNVITSRRSGRSCERRHIYSMV